MPKQLAFDAEARRKLKNGVVPIYEPGLEELLKRNVEVTVDDQIIELLPVGHVAQRVREPALDDRFGVGLAASQPVLELRDARWEDEDAARVRRTLSHLSRALPVDLEYHRAALGEQVVHVLTTRAVPVVEYARMLEERPTLDHRQKLGLRDEEIIASMDLGAATPPGGV